MTAQAMHDLLVANFIERHNAERQARHEELMRETGEG